MPRPNGSGGSPDLLRPRNEHHRRELQVSLDIVANGDRDKCVFLLTLFRGRVLIPRRDPGKHAIHKQLASMMHSSWNGRENVKRTK